MIIYRGYGIRTLIIPRNMVKNDPKQLIFENSGAKARNWNSTNIVRITTAMGLFTSSFEAKYKIISTTIDNKAQINVSMWFIHLNPMNKMYRDGLLICAGHFCIKREILRLQGQDLVIINLGQLGKSSTLTHFEPIWDLSLDNARPAIKIVLSNLRIV